MHYNSQKSQAPVPLLFRGIRGIRHTLPAGIRKADKNIPKVQNIVAVFNSKANLNLGQASNNAKVGEFRPITFAALLLRFSDFSVSIYTTGKQIAAGSDCLWRAWYASFFSTFILGFMKRRVNVYEKNSPIIKKVLWAPLIQTASTQRPMTIANIVAKSYFNPKYIMIPALARMFSDIGTYSPATFAAFRIFGFCLSASLFKSGWCLLLGVKEMEHLVPHYEVVKAMVIESYAQDKVFKKVKHYIWYQQRKVFDEGSLDRFLHILPRNHCMIREADQARKRLFMPIIPRLVDDYSSDLKSNYESWARDQRNRPKKKAVISDKDQRALNFETRIREYHNDISHISPEHAVSNSLQLIELRKRRPSAFRDIYTDDFHDRIRRALCHMSLDGSGVS